MEKLNGKNKLIVSVFISGRGTNLKSLIDFSKNKNSTIKIVLVICNNKNAKGINYAKKNKIKFLIVNYKNKKKAENIILKNLKKNSINLICLAGFMKILTKKIVNIYKNRILNIHPSLLPKYKGLNTYKRAIEKGDKLFGCTVHYVNEKLDSGKIIIKKRVHIANTETVEKLKKKVQVEEYKAYAIAIRRIYNLN